MVSSIAGVLQILMVFAVVVAGAVGIIAILILLLLRRGPENGYAQWFYGLLIVMGAHAASVPVGMAIDLRIPNIIASNGPNWRYTSLIGGWLKDD